MDKEFNKKYVEFINKMDERYCRPSIAMSGDEISAYDFINGLNNRLEKYNKVFFGGRNRIIDSFNRRNGYTVFTPEYKDKKYRRIGNVGFYVEENGYYYILLYFVDSRGKLTGTGIVDNFVKLDACDPETVNNKKYLMKYLEVLSDFQRENPEVSFRWDTLNPISENIVVGDGFIDCTINPYSLKYICPYFANSSDDKFVHHKSDYAFDVVSQCGEVFLKNMPVNLNDVNPSLSTLVRKEYGLDGQKLVK